MSGAFSVFENIVRRAKNVGASGPAELNEAHPFDQRNIHPEIASIALRLFDDGHYSQATFEAFKLLDQKVKVASGIDESGYKLMMSAFNEAKPKIALNGLATTSEKDEQLGFKHVFAGAMSAIRNPRGHEILADPIDLCLDHLSFASVLLRRFDSRVPAF